MRAAIPSMCPGRGADVSARSGRSDRSSIFFSDKWRFARTPVDERRRRNFAKTDHQNGEIAHQTTSSRAYEHHLCAFTVHEKNGWGGKNGWGDLGGTRNRIVVALLEGGYSVV